jgi:hypothetical protein
MGIVLETHFRFGFPNGCGVGDSLIEAHPIITAPSARAKVKGCKLTNANRKKPLYIKLLTVQI